MDETPEQFDLETIRLLPPSPGLSFRGRGSGTWQVGAWYTEPDWLITSRDPRIGTDDFAHRDVVALFGACGRDLHDNRRRREEHETVFLPGAVFTVLRKGFVGTTWLQILVVNRDDGRPERVTDVEIQVRRAVNAVRASLAAPPTEPVRSRRFCGGFGVPTAAPDAVRRPGVGAEVRPG